MVSEASGEASRASLSVSLKEFEGPLDLLLYLIQKAQVNIYDIPIAEITEQFILYLDLSAQLDLDDLSEFYLLASQLLLIKSRMLLPRDKVLDDDELLEDPREELVMRLLEYQKYKRYAQLLSGTEQSDELYIPRRKQQFMLPFSDSELWEEVTVWDLLKTFSSLLRSITSEQVFNVYEEVTTRQKLTLMQELFLTHTEISFLDIVVKPDSPMDVICAFLALLEAVKYHMVFIVQHRLFGDIVIKKREEVDLDEIEIDYNEEQLEHNGPSDSKLEENLEVYDETIRTTSTEIDGEELIIELDDE